MTAEVVRVPDSGCLLLRDWGKEKINFQAEEEAYRPVTR